MLNRLLRPVLAACLCASAPGAFAQASVPVPTPAAASPAPAANAVNLTLLQRALAPLVTSRAVDSESEMTIYASKAGSVFTLREHLKVTARRPGKFVSQVTLVPEAGTKAIQYQIASDGVKVTTFRPGLRKYSVAPLAQFEAGDQDFPSLGLIVGLLYLGDTSFIKGLSSISKDNTGQSQTMLRKMGMAMSSKSVTMSGVSYEAFTLQLGQIGQYRFYVSPDTAHLAQVEMRTVQDGVSIRMVEKVITFTPRASVLPAVFKPALPLSAKKVKQLTVGFF